MPQYHGDVMYRVGNVYSRPDDRNYPIVLLLLFFFGATGIHRFYLNDQSIAFLYFGAFAFSIFVGFASLSLMVPLIYLGLASIPLLCEFFYFCYCWAKQVS